MTGGAVVDPLLAILETRGAIRSDEHSNSLVLAVKWLDTYGLQIER